MINFYINLDSAVARRDWMEGQFSKLGITAQRVSAVTVEEVSQKPSGITFGNRMGRPWFDAEKACFLSHRECWKRIVEGNHDFGAIFEDDVHFSPDAAKFLSGSWWIPQGVEVIKLETYLHKVMFEKRGVPVLDRSLHRVLSTHIGGAGYILHRDAAAILLEKSMFVEMPLDLLLFDPDHNFGFQFWQLNAAICVQDDRLRQKAPQFESQIAPSSSRGVGNRSKPKSLGGKVFREIIRVCRQINFIANHPSRPFKMRRAVVEYR